MNQEPIEELDNHHLLESGIEPVESEEEDLDQSPARYDLVTYPADFTLEGLVDKLRKSQIEVPGFQRRFVWTIKQASKLIESFILGLPVPPIFLYTDAVDNHLSVIDGQQRLKSILYFFDGFFGEEVKGKRTVFKLKGLNPESQLLGKSYEDLAATLPYECNQLHNAVLRAFIVRQMNPKDNTSIYHIFERLNTGSTQLTSQEVRNCVYHGRFNELLMSLNGNGSWRTVFGNPQEDKRQRDVELILRFLALHHKSDLYKRPMKDFLSNFMGENRNAAPEILDAHRAVFEKTIERVAASLGPKPFHIKMGLNAAVFDSVMVAYASQPEAQLLNMKQKLEALVKDSGYLDAVSARTANEDVVEIRILVAKRMLFGG